MISGLPFFSRLRRRHALSLALQGGGAHGAFTWGVLERLLEESWLDVRAVSGASAGALNGVALAGGWVDGGRAGAREALSDFWKAVSDASDTGIPSTMLALLAGVWPTDGSGNARLLEALPRLGSPYELSPDGYHPLRRMLTESLDLDAIRHARSPRLRIAATNVHSGRTRIFNNEQVTVETLLASTCLPSFFRAVEIDGQYYWDGGYSMNPPLTPLLRGHWAPDALIVQLSPTWRETVPTGSEEISDRIRELAFNAGLLRELETLAGLSARERRRHPRLHLIDADGHLDMLERHAALNTDWGFLNQLRTKGHGQAEEWLVDGRRAIGRHASLRLDDYAVTADGRDD